MNILIKGMEMPKNEPLLVKINPDSSVSTTAKNGYKKGSITFSAGCL